MRIAIDLRSLMETGGKISGVENYSVNIFNGLQKENSGSIFGFYNSFKNVTFPKDLQKENLLNSSIPNKVLNLTLSIFNFPKFENLYGDFDYLWLPDLRPFAIKRKTKLAITVHDLSPIMHPEFYSLRRNIWHRLINYKKSFQRADVIFAVSEYTKFDLIKIFKLSEDKIKVVYPAINQHVFKLDLDQRLKHKVKEKYDLPEKFILSLSTIEPRKNILGTIRAYESLNISDLHLVIAGRPGWLYNNVLEAWQNSIKKNKIHFIGYIPEADKPFLIAQAEMLCYPSFYEGFGFQPLEAMACGVPVITSARTSMPEICGDAALLIEPYHTNEIALAMKSLLTDTNLKNNLITKGLERVKKFNWDITCQEILTALEK